MLLGDAGDVIDGPIGAKGEAGIPGRFGYDGFPGIIFFQTISFDYD